MVEKGSNGDSGGPGGSFKRYVAGADQSASDADQTASDTEQTAADADQASSDRDEHASANDQKNSDADAAASRADQRLADAEHSHPGQDAAADEAYEASRTDREKRTSNRHASTMSRADSAMSRTETSHDRDETGEARDATAALRDADSLVRDAWARDIANALATVDESLAQEFEELRIQAAADRARAAAERARAASARADAARERGRLEAELRMAHLDALTGAYRREMGQHALEQEIARARRSDGRFVLAFVDIDDLKQINDGEGHAAGDRALQAAVTAIRAKLRSFDPVIRYGGDEFVCGVGGTHLVEAQHRFATIARGLKKDAGVGISVGLAELGPEESVEQLLERADASLLRVKAQRTEGSIDGAAS